MFTILFLQLSCEVIQIKKTELTLPLPHYGVYSHHTISIEVSMLVSRAEVHSGFPSVRFTHAHSAFLQLMSNKSTHFNGNQSIIVS